MSDFLKKLKGVFIQEDPNKPAAQAPQNTAPKAASKEAAPVYNTPSVSAGYSPPAASSGATNGQANDKFMDVLFQSYGSS